MKTLSISITLLLTIALFTQCNKEDTTDTAKKEEKERHSHNKALRSRRWWIFQRFNCVVHVGVNT